MLAGRASFLSILFFLSNRVFTGKTLIELNISKVYGQSYHRAYVGFQLYTQAVSPGDMASHTKNGRFVSKNHIGSIR